MLNAMSACRCAPPPSVNGNRAGVAGQPSGHTTRAKPMGITGILNGGQVLDHQRRQVDLASTVMASYALSEREAGSDAASMRTRAKPMGITGILNGGQVLDHQRRQVDLASTVMAAVLAEPAVAGLIGHGGTGGAGGHSAQGPTAMAELVVPAGPVATADNSTAPAVLAEPAVAGLIGHGGTGGAGGHSAQGPTAMAERHLVGTDVLGDAAGLGLADVGLAGWCPTAGVLPWLDVTITVTTAGEPEGLRHLVGTDVLGDAAGLGLADVGLAGWCPTAGVLPPCCSWPIQRAGGWPAPYTRARLRYSIGSPIGVPQEVALIQPDVPPMPCCAHVALGRSNAQGGGPRHTPAPGCGTQSGRRLAYQARVSMPAWRTPRVRTPERRCVWAWAPSATSAPIRRSRWWPTPAGTAWRCRPVCQCQPGARHV